MQTFANGSGGCKDANDVLLTYSCSANSLGAQLNPYQADTTAVSGVTCAHYIGDVNTTVLTLVCLSVP